MAAPRKTAGMLNFERQLTQAFPDRQLPDGWIADENHTGVSSHHPDDTPGSKPEWDGDPDNIPDVRGVDVWSNLGEGVKAIMVCRHMAELPGLGAVVRYFIHAGYIWHVRNGFVPVLHTGDPHPTHIHVTFAFTEAADDNVTYNYRFEEIPVALTQADREWFSQQISKVVGEINQVPADTVNYVFDKQGDVPPGKTSVRQTSAWSDSNIHRIEEKLDAVVAAVTPPVKPAAPKR